jgi:PleD family two-component response regulator
MRSWSERESGSLTRSATPLLARYVGEKLCAILPDTPLDEAVTIAERVLEAIRALETTAVDGRRFKVTACCSIVETRGQVGGPGSCAVEQRPPIK